MKIFKILNFKNFITEASALIKVNFDCLFADFFYPEQKCKGNEKDIIYLIPGIGGHPKHMNWLKSQLEFYGFHVHLARKMKPIGILDLKLSSGIKRLIVLYKRDLEKLKEKHPKVEKIIIIGHSLGGLIALSLLLWQKEKINYIITLGSPIAQGLKEAEILGKFFKTANDISSKSSIYPKIKKRIEDFGLSLKITAIIGKKDILISKKEGVLALVNYFIVNEGHISLIRSKEVLEKILFILYQQINKNSL